MTWIDLLPYGITLLIGPSIGGVVGSMVLRPTLQIVRWPWAIAIVDFAMAISGMVAAGIVFGLLRNDPTVLLPAELMIVWLIIRGRGLAEGDAGDLWGMVGYALGLVVIWTMWE